MFSVICKRFPSSQIKFFAKGMIFLYMAGIFWGWQNYAYASEQKSSNSLPPLTVGASAIVEHPSLDMISRGAKDQLIEAGYILGKNLNFIYQTAQNRQATAIQIAHKFVGDSVDILLPIGTAASQAAINSTKTIPVVFSGVTDPVEAGLLKDAKHPNRNVTGISDLPDIAKQLTLIQKLFPKAKTIGFPYNPGEANSLSFLKRLKTLAKEKGISIVESPAIQTAQVRNAMLYLVGKVDAIYIGTDNTIVSAIETALNVANKNKIPVITADAGSVEAGALATISSDYYQLGKATGRLILKIVQATPISELPVETLPATELVLNQKTANLIGYSFPPSILEKASKIIR